MKARISYNKKSGKKFMRMGLAASTIARDASPGQFLNIRVSDAVEPLLRRPFSIHRASGSKAEILYQIVGKATEILSRKSPGEYLDIIGPLGNGFNYRLPVTGYRLPILVAGGMGIAPLFFLAEKIANRQPLVLIGAKTKDDILCEKEFKKIGCEVKIATDDGSKGYKGRVTDLLKKVLRLAISDKRLAIYACGPRPMLKVISGISMEHNIPAQVSLEEHMACGIGACLGCAVETRGGFKRACKEGPVFEAGQIIWGKE